MSVRLTRAEQRERTRQDLVAAAERLFVDRGFHATSVDQVAEEAGYTKGAVYSNFDSKEELFLAVFDARAGRGASHAEDVLSESGDEEGLRRLVSDSMRRRGREDGWLAVFLEFWAHAVRHPQLRDRFAAIHARGLAPTAAASERLARERGLDGGVRSGRVQPGHERDAARAHARAPDRPARREPRPRRADGGPER